MYWNKRIYYDKTYGDPIQETGGFKSTRERYSVEYEISIYPNLSERNRDTFDVLELENGQYVQDFAECSGYRVNPETLELEFSYPDPNEPEALQPFVKPLSVEVQELKQETKAIKIQSAQSNAELFEMMLIMTGGMM